MWRVDQAPTLAAELLADLGRRWEHVQTVGRLADQLVSAGRLAPAVAAGAWLHDVGYAPALRVTGFHALDGASHVRRIGAPDEIVALVAWHTGALFEAEERGLSEELWQMPRPDSGALDALTLLDLVAAPDGGLTDPEARLSEILSRYDESSPVYRAVTLSRDALLASAEQARTRLGLSDEWPRGGVESVLKA